MLDVLILTTIDHRLSPLSTDTKAPFRGLYVFGGRGGIECHRYLIDLNY